MPIMPLLAFVRRGQIELVTGLILPGDLVVDIPSDREPSERETLMVTDIVQALTAEVQAGKLSDDAIVYGWRDGRSPCGRGRHAQ